MATCTHPMEMLRAASQRLTQEIHAQGESKAWPIEMPRAASQRLPQEMHAQGESKAWPYSKKFTNDTTTREVRAIGHKEKQRSNFNQVSSYQGLKYHDRTRQWARRTKHKLQRQYCATIIRDTTKTGPCQQNDIYATATARRRAKTIPPLFDF